jgi:hypothetical protein
MGAVGVKFDPTLPYNSSFKLKAAAYNAKAQPINKDQNSPNAPSRH